MLLEVKTGDLFKNAPENSVLVHSCNCVGLWGRGIAVEFANRYPDALRDYMDYCNLCRPKVGTARLMGIQKKVGCLFTSYHFGRKADSQEQIADATYLAALELLDIVSSVHPAGTEIHSPMINSGLLKTPWPLSEKAILKALTDTQNRVKWVVWKLPQQGEQTHGSIASSDSILVSMYTSS